MREEGGRRKEGGEEREEGEGGGRREEGGGRREEGGWRREEGGREEGGERREERRLSSVRTHPYLPDVHRMLDDLVVIRKFLSRRKNHEDLGEVPPAPTTNISG